MMRVRLLLVAPLLFLVSCMPEDTQFLLKINTLRESKGLAPVTSDSAIAATSCAWNAHLMDINRVYHDPELREVFAATIPGWTLGGENVGKGRNVDLLFEAFVASPTHYAVLVNPIFRRIGICVARNEDNVLFTTHRLVAP